jgi:DNA helicase-2/ATP-dependent DNA helicase PcrA
LAAETGAEYWKYYAHKQLAAVESTEGKGKEIRLFGCVFVGEKQDGTAIIAHKPHTAQPLRVLNNSDAEIVRKTKREVWKKHGLLTHSDVALVASKILADKNFGAVVRAEVARRFPYLIVDELQDTGHFLGMSIRKLLEEPSMRGFLVGDPDQAIYEFNGAKPHLFKTFEQITGAISLTLGSSRRCPPSIAKAAAHLSDSGSQMQGATDRPGRALLVRYTNMNADVAKLLKAIRVKCGASALKIIARGTATVEDLTGRHTTPAPNLHCPPITHVHRGVTALRKNKNALALACVRTGLERAVFHHEGVTDEELHKANLDSVGWKGLAVRCLLKANQISTDGSFLEWQTRVGQMIEEEINGIGLVPSTLFIPGKIKPQNRKGAQDACKKYIPTMQAAQAPNVIPAQTVHAVKGETHDVTIFVCPPTKVDRCPSCVWWSQHESDREERRIAYVAMTRTRGNLILCVPEATYKRLAVAQPGFLQCFDAMTIAECVAALSDQSV